MLVGVFSLITEYSGQGCSSSPSLFQSSCCHGYMHEMDDIFICPPQMGRKHRTVVHAFCHACVSKDIIWVVAGSASCHAMPCRHGGKGKCLRGRQERRWEPINVNIPGHCVQKPPSRRSHVQCAAGARHASRQLVVWAVPPSLSPLPEGLFHLKKKGNSGQLGEGGAKKHMFPKQG